MRQRRQRHSLIKHDGMHTNVGEPEEGDERGPYSEEELRLMNDKFSSALAREHADDWWRRRQR